MIFETIIVWSRFDSFLSLAGGIPVFLLDLARLVFCIIRLGWQNFFNGFLFHTNTPLALFSCILLCGKTFRKYAKGRPLCIIMVNDFLRSPSICQFIYGRIFIQISLFYLPEGCAARYFSTLFCAFWRIL
jgi:hypothetical protein